MEPVIPVKDRLNGEETTAHPIGPIKKTMAHVSELPGFPKGWGEGN